MCTIKLFHYEHRSIRNITLLRTSALMFFFTPKYLYVCSFIVFCIGMCLLKTFNVTIGLHVITVIPSCLQYIGWRGVGEGLTFWMGEGRSPSPPKPPSLYVVFAKANLGYLNRSKLKSLRLGRPPLNTPTVSHMSNISGHNVNFVCGLVDESIDQWDKCEMPKVCQDMHKCHNYHAILHKL